MTVPTKDSVSVVVPVYNSAKSLSLLVEKIVSSMDHHNIQFEIILVDDGSKDSSWESIVEASGRSNFIVGVKLSKNFGQHNATLAGIRIAKYDYIATIDDDLQFDPMDIPSLLKNLKDSGADVCYGVPKFNSAGPMRRAYSKIFRKTLAFVLGISTSSDLSPFRVFRSDLRQGFQEQLGPDVSIDALLSWVSGSITSYTVIHHERRVGKSNYNFRKLLSHALDSATAYSSRPLKAASLLGLLVSSGGALMFVVVISQALVLGTSVPGYATLAGALALFSGIQLLSLGIIGEYLARMHFRVMNKPSYNISKISASKQRS